MGNLWRQNTQRCLLAYSRRPPQLVRLSVVRGREGVSESDGGREGVKVERYLACQDVFLRRNAMAAEGLTRCNCEASSSSPSAAAGLRASFKRILLNCEWYCCRLYGRNLQNSWLNPLHTTIQLKTKTS